MSMVEVFAAKLHRDLCDDEIQALLSLVSDEKRERIYRLKQRQDALRTLIGDVLVRILICERLGVRNKDLTFDKNDWGKPFLASHPDVHFNIAHSGHWVACCIDTQPAGIDIQKIKKIDINLAKRFFSQKEYEYLMSLHEFRRKPAFFELWALKESYVKALGKGMSIPFRSFTIIDEAGNIKLESENETAEYYFKKFFIDNDYKMTVCTLNKEIIDNIVIVSLDEMLKIASML